MSYTFFCIDQGCVIVNPNGDDVCITENENDAEYLCKYLHTLFGQEDDEDA